MHLLARSPPCAARSPLTALVSEYSQSLSERRARAVAQWLTTQGGIEGNRFEPRGYGEAQPVAPNVGPDGTDNPLGRRQNRRVEVRLPR